MPRHVTSLPGPSPRQCALGQQSSFQRNIAAVASRWLHCVRFDRPEISTSDLPLQSHTCYRSTNLWPVITISNIVNETAMGLLSIDFVLME